MKLHPNHTTRLSTASRGFTLLEVCVALVVFSIAITGLLPLVTILSRQLEPIKISTGNYKCFSPARDGNKTGTDLAFSRHIWHLSAYNEPWVRKLGASAQLVASATSSGTSTTSSFPLESAIQTYNDNGDDFTALADWINESVAAACGANQHRKEALLNGVESTGSAEWQMTVPVTGRYSIQATWHEAPDQIRNAVFSVHNGATELGIRTVNQSLRPVGVTSNSNGTTLYWEALYKVVQLTEGDIITVKLSDVRGSSDGNGTYVVADAVRLVRENTVKIKSIDRSLSGVNENGSGDDITVQVSVTINIPVDPP